MKWLDTPPCGRMDVTFANEVRLELRGPSKGTRAAGAGAAAFGATFAGVALRFARLPVPVPGAFKLIPLALGVAGGAVAALGLGTAVAHSTILVTRRGVELRWRWGPMAEKSMMVERETIAATEVESHVHESSDDWGGNTRSVTYRLNLVRKDGTALPIEEFGLSAQAMVRKEQLDRLLG